MDAERRRRGRSLPYKEPEPTPPKRITLDGVARVAIAAFFVFAGLVMLAMAVIMSRACC